MTVLLKDGPCGYGGMERAKSRRNGLKNLLEHLKNPLEQNLKNLLEQPQEPAGAKDAFFPG